MEIKYTNQLNQGVGKYKTLSSNAGVGSIVSTKWGGFIMPSSSSEWGFVQAVQQYIAQHPNENPLNYKKLTEDLCVEFVEDNRFVDFLKKTEDMAKLRCLVAIPHITLDIYNRCDLENQPLNAQYRALHPGTLGMGADIFTIPATPFPRWFISKDRQLKTLEEWQHIWQQMHLPETEFAPPRDPYDRKRHRNRRTGQEIDVYGLLEQSDMALICPNGHISDIPWLKYFCAKMNRERDLNEPGFDLFGYDEATCPCTPGRSHELKWLENRNQTESFGVLKCVHCGQYVSLEGIMNLQPKCPGEKPWEGLGARDHHECQQGNDQPSAMKWAMVTSNSVYLAENFTSLYIPGCYLQGEPALNDVQQAVLHLMRTKWYPKWRDDNGGTEAEYIKATGIAGLIDKADDSGRTLSAEEMQLVVDAFCPAADNNADDEETDVREDYRYTEYAVFHDNDSSLAESDKLVFKDISLPDRLTGLLDKIQCVDTLALTCTQINFSRVQMPQAQVIDGVVRYPSSQKIFKGDARDVTVMPALQTFGEGLFFSFDEQAVSDWAARYADLFNKRYGQAQPDDMYESLYQKMQRGGMAKFYLLHTFSHILMKELEFSCGYPTSSLGERLYFSERMCGVLIYTADGSEGSMGGLVWQGQRDIIENIILSALHRAQDCSSDPICWENEDQLNHAACFSCAMVSETSCEERNLGLDRRALVDEDFGFFKDLVQ